MLFISTAILISCCYAMDIYPSHIRVPDITKFIVKPGKMLLPNFIYIFFLSKDIPGYLLLWD
jgi:hypothetical protein